MADRRAQSPPPLSEQDSGPQQLLPEPASRLSGPGEDEGPETVSAATQTVELAEAAVQYEAPGAGAEPFELEEQLHSLDLAAFLAGAVPRCEAALQQNELLDLLGDELAALADEDGGEAVVGAPGAGAASRSAAAGLAELHSFSDLVHSKGRALAAVTWHPARRGVVAVACTQQQPFSGAEGPAAAATGSGRAGASGRVGPAHASHAAGRQEAAAAAGAVGTAADQLRQPAHGCILVWSHSDAIHPELVLQPPTQALAFAFHPTAPHAWLAAGLSTGQVALFNLQQAAAAAASAAAGGPPGAAAGSATPPLSGAADEGREESSRAAVLLPAFVSSPDACHQAPITDLQWLPGLMVTKDGRLEACAAEGGEGSGNAGAAAAPAQAADACTLFATTSADGSLLLWDMRISTRQRKAAKDEEGPEWKPAMALAPASQPLLATRFCLDARAGMARFLLGSLEGELAVVEVAPNLQEQQGTAADWILSPVQQAVGHTGRVLALAFSPFFSDALLVVGDGGFVVWRVGAGGKARRGSGEGPAGDASAASATGADGRCVAVFESPFCMDTLYTCGCWSPSQPGVVIMGRADGRLEAWDLLDRSHQAAMVTPVAPCALTTLAASPAASAGAAAGRAAPQVLAVGDAAGTLRLLELPRALRRRGYAEVRAMGALLAREQERLAEVARRAEARAAEARAAAERQSAAAAAAVQGAARRQQEAAAAANAGAQLTEEDDDDAERAAERRYLALEAEWRERLLGGGGAAPGIQAVPTSVAS